ncbi:F-box/FBD/LRR-repeat protein At1g13570-like isoform X2 [Nicotiana sylvestris]|uniref:F-box/FBD/LRR-repeat protein At1g13570-like isoform X2 n=1 Tax=Nicotiana sylvestris TaxID=4096 RepID=A0A1U7W3K9_NICSY|nr:PREDICTED: F-box/FBD/LRR-repeat protein At1g13570-like isoform X2 [Nicotiana sylvestris]
MRHLRLQNCSIQPPSAFRGFDELVSLELYDITFSSELLNILISRCPLLEKLVLQISSILNHIQIDAPKLRSFDFSGGINDISLMKAPLLEKLSLFNTAVPSGKAGQLDLAKYFESFPALEHLNLDYLSVQVYYAALIDPVRGDVVNDIPASFSDVTLNHLRVVKLEGITGTKPEIELIKLLLAKSPMLVKMLIQPNKGKVFAETRLKVLCRDNKISKSIT